jgi:ribonuclease HI
MNTYYLYSDGNYFPRAKKSGFGGYIKDPSGEILIEYTEQIKEQKYIFNFELLGIIRGLLIARDMGIENLLSHCDDKTTVDRLKEIMASGGDCSEIPTNAKPELFQTIVDLTKQFKSISFEYIPRSQNKHSDSLSRKYATLMEKNFLIHYENELDFSEKVFAGIHKLTRKIFFSHPAIQRIEHKNNPYLVASVRNKKVRKFSKQEQIDNYEYLFIETHIQNDIMSFKAFHYDQNKNKSLLTETNFSIEENHLKKYCEFLSNSLKQISHNKIWINNNNKFLNNFFEQKEKINNTDFPLFKEVYNSLNNFIKVMFNNFPFEHEFSPEIAQKEQDKKSLNENIENIDYLIEQLQNGSIDKNKKKAFGMLVKHHLRNYKKVLQRDLNEIEKAEIIKKTTDELLKKGITNLPTISQTINQKI